MQELYDLHVHTQYSHDADRSDNNSILNLCKTAQKKGLSGLAFSDHMDADLYYAGKQAPDLEGIKKDCHTAKEMFPQLHVIHSAEFAQQMYFQGLCSDLIKKYDFDMVITSIHVIEANLELIIAQLDFSKMSGNEARHLFETYVREAAYTAKYCDYDVFAHLTYPLRYLKRAGCDDIAPIEKDMDLYDEILKTLIRRGKALEINTSGIRQGHGDTFPNMLLAKRYMELGGELFTVGSDSHNPADLGADIADTTEQLRNIGAKYTVYYMERKPIFIKI